MRVQPSSRSFALCVEDGGMEDLEARKVYQILPDREAAREGYIRVVDESVEDYVHPSEPFVPVRLPAAVVRRLRGPVRSRSAAARGTIRRVRQADRHPSSEAFADPSISPLAAPIPTLNASVRDHAAPAPTA